jgi:hypothetical protein
MDDISFKTTSALNFEPTLIARHSQRLGELTDRCLNIRKDIRELEVLAVKAATDYELFNNTSKIDEQMDVLRLQTDSKTKEQVGFQNAAAAFVNAVTLEKGLSEIAKGRDGALGADLMTSNELKSLIGTRWRDLRAYQDAYNARYTEPGNAHNYGERAGLLLQALTVLLDEALARASALATGIYRIYGVKITDVTYKRNVAGHRSVLGVGTKDHSIPVARSRAGNGLRNCYSFSTALAPDSGATG